MGEEFTAKDFRTWGGTLTAAIALAEHGVAETEAEAKRTVANVMRTVGERLGNTPTVARTSYVSPAVVEQYLDGRTIEDFRPRHLRVVKARDIGLDPEENALLSLLRSWRIKRAPKRHDFRPRLRYRCSEFVASSRRNTVARKTVLVSDISGAEIADGKGATVRITFHDARKGVRELDVTDAEAERMGGRQVARRGRRPKSATQ